MKVMERSSDSAWWLVFGCWLVASASTLGALFFSEVVNLPPCILCWYQRIFMFPLVLLLVIGVIPESIRPCTQGVPCSDVQIEWLGFLNIPLLSFIAFSTMNVLLIAALFRSPR